MKKPQITTSKIIERATAMGWRIQRFPHKKALIKVFTPRVKHGFYLQSSINTSTGYIEAVIARDKFITSLELENRGIPTIPTVISSRVSNRLKNQVGKMLDDGVVVKPVGGSHGDGVTVNVRAMKDFIAAVGRAQKITDAFVVQKMVSGYDLRCVCIGGKFVSSIMREPAYVIGDGTSTVKELIKLENATTRTKDYSSFLSIIPLRRALQFLGKDSNNIPKNGEKVYVMGLSNTGVGGVRHNADQIIPECLIELSELTSKALGLEVCGIDFILAKIPEPSDSLEDLMPVVLEVNHAPALTMFEDLDSAQQNKLIDEYLLYSERQALTKRKYFGRSLLMNKVLIKFPDFPELLPVNAKIDTGAYTGALHYDDMKVDSDGKLVVATMGSKLVFDKEHYTKKRVKSSEGSVSERYIVRLKIDLGGIINDMSITLNNRDTMRYPVIIGRKYLKNKFIVIP